ncbi:TerC family protein [Metabacillus sp. GX 13764]|uniref:TerC family protein n=1 Tax=Metabacillus kandeliae TaxID=2900151 RepID=UPI001E57CE06|nr:TerC family protein [Metabacillus kandeliae]MCD7033456.1 TerC family protein [Metabacillus kandeliae]
MGFFEGILHTYSQFFNGHMWVEALSNPVNWGLIGTLVILEGLLSADNALVLAVMVKPLPPEKRKKALFYGLIGAYLFRFIAIGIGVYLIQLSWVKILGAAYLAWLSIKYFIDKRKGEEGEDPEEEAKLSKKGLLTRMFGTFWGTVVSVELMDIAFSVDSVLAAFGVSEKIWVLLIGGMLGVLMMRGVAGLFLKLIEKVPELETTAYLLIAIIAIKMALSVAGIEIPHAVFFIILIVMFGGTFIVNKMKSSGKQEKRSNP